MSKKHTQMWNDASIYQLKGFVEDLRDQVNLLEKAVEVIYDEKMPFPRLDFESFLANLKVGYRSFQSVAPEREDKRVDLAGLSNNKTREAET